MNQKQSSKKHPQIFDPNYEEIQQEQYPSLPNQKIEDIQKQPQISQKQDKTQHVRSNIENYDSFLYERVLQIEKPEVIKEGYLVSYKLYTLKSRNKNSQYYDTIVHRRFNDFEFLHHQLIENYGGCVLPKLPEKNILAKFDIEEKIFQQNRVKLLQNYLTVLINHKRVRYSMEFRNFLFLEDVKFSLQKGKYAEQNTYSNQFNEIKNSVIGMSKMIYEKFVGSKQYHVQFSKDNQQQRNLRLFQFQIEELIKIIKQIKPIVQESHQQFKIITDIILTHDQDKKQVQKQKQFNDKFKAILEEFQEINQFVSNCHEAINRTKQLRSQILSLQQNLKEMQIKERNNPRNIELDIIRGQIQKKNSKCQRWLGFLNSQLQIYTKEGKTLMEHFVRKFNILKGDVYSILE